MIDTFLSVKCLLTFRQQNIVCYPIAKGKMINVGAFVGTPSGEERLAYDGPWVSPTTVEDVTKQFSGWDENVQSILKVSRMVQFSTSFLSLANRHVFSVCRTPICGQSIPSESYPHTWRAMSPSSAMRYVYVRMHNSRLF